MGSDELSTQNEPTELDDLELQPAEAEEVRGGTDPTPTESLSFTFSKPKVTYKP